MSTSTPKYVLKIYVTGETPKAALAIRNLRKICDSAPHGRYKLVIIDVLENPDLAEQENILAIPTVVRELPLPVRRIVGDLSLTEKVLMGLDIPESNGKIY